MTGKGFAPIEILVAVMVLGAIVLGGAYLYYQGGLTIPPTLSQNAQQPRPTHTNGTPPPPASTPTPVTVATGTIPSSFFATSIQVCCPKTGTDFPPASMSLGAYGHPTLFSWGWIEQAKGQYKWGRFDDYVNGAKNRGLVDENGVVNVTLTFSFTPGWAIADHTSCKATFGPTLCTAPPDNMQDWKDFLTAVMNHYDGVTASHVKYYEIWNEANGSNYWTGTPQQLVAMAAQAYPIIHSDPYAEVISPSINAGTNWKTWLTSYLNAQDPVTGKHGYEVADIASFHAYLGSSAPPEAVRSEVASRRATYDANGMSGKPIFQTEGSWGKNIPPTPDTQVAWLARYYLIQAGLYDADNLLMSSWYTWGLQQPGNSWGQIENSDGTPAAAALAYGVLTKWLVGNVVSPCNQSGTVWTCGLTRSGAYEALAIWNTNGSSSYTPESKYTTYRDLSGGTFTVNGPITIGIKPLLLEGTVAKAL